MHQRPHVTGHHQCASGQSTPTGSDTSRTSDLLAGLHGPITELSDLVRHPIANTRNGVLGNLGDNPANRGVAHLLGDLILNCGPQSRERIPAAPVARASLPTAR